MFPPPHTQREMDTLIAANKDRKNWPSEQTEPEPTVPIVKMYVTPAELKKRLQEEKQQELEEQKKAEAAAAEAGDAAENGDTTTTAKKKKKKKKKNLEPTQFPPIDGEVVELENIDKEKERQKEMAHEAFQDELWKARMAAQAHKTTRKWLKSWVKPGMTMQYICETTENKIRELYVL